jgi:hypothetical protein
MPTPEELQDLSPAKRAIYEIRSLRARVEQLEKLHNDPVAIVGMGMRFPGDAVDPGSFWKLLARGVDAVTEIPDSRWPAAQYYDADPDAPWQDVHAPWSVRQRRGRVRRRLLRDLASRGHFDGSAAPFSDGGRVGSPGEFRLQSDGLGGLFHGSLSIAQQ